MNPPDWENMRLVERALYRAKKIKQPDGSIALEPERPAAFKLERPNEPEAAAEGELMADCPACGAGVPARLEVCPVCRYDLHAKGNEDQPEIPAGAVSAPPREVVHSHTFLALSSRALLLFFLLTAGAFLAFVYFLTH